MSTYEAPAKLNLSLLVSSPRSDGYHPLRSLVQTIEWCDLLSVVKGETSDGLEIEGADLDVEDNLVTKAVEVLRSGGATVPPLTMKLTKRLSVAAGLGGGSSDAAAALKAAADVAALNDTVIEEAAPKVGADVPLFLTGGSCEVTGVGEKVQLLDPLDGFAVSVAVPHFGLSAKDVYRRWDEMAEPQGEAVPDHHLPPPLRGAMPMRNDLLPAALDMEPRLGDFMADVREVWGSAVALTGSGSACFGYFGAMAEAKEAAAAVDHLGQVAVGVELRNQGVAPSTRQ